MIKNEKLNRVLCGAIIVTSVMISNGQELVQRHSVEEGNRMLKTMMSGVNEKTTFFASIASSFRESGMEDPGAAIQFYFAESARAAWKVSVEDILAVQQLTDFFTGAMMLSGPVRQQDGIVGLYNPWWDGILLLQIKKEDKLMEGQPIGKIAKFRFVSGEAFRGEELPDDVDCRTVVPEKNPLSPELWRVTAGTRQKFEEYFPIGDQSGIGWGTKGTKLIKRLEDDSIKGKDRDRLIVRSALRLQHSVALLKNNRDTGIAAVLTRLARNGNVYQLYQHFREKNSRPLLQSFAKIPEMFRKDFTPYCYVPTESGTLYVLVNKKVPRLYVTVSLLPQPTAVTSSMEWFDLIQADELLAAWNNRKEVAK